MPEMDGIELAQAIALAPSLRAARLIMLTSTTDRRMAAREAGIDHYLQKPVRRARLLETIAEVMGAAERPEPAPSRTGRTPRGTASGDVVLVVEDNVVNQRVIEAMLAKRGYAVELAGNGREALTLLSVRSYALVFMDCQMPEMDGYAATAAIRAREQGTSRLPIVAMTAHAMKGDRERCLAAGMDDYLSKPLRPEELDAALERWLGAPGAAPTPVVAAKPRTVVAAGDPFEALLDDARMRVFRVDYPEIVPQLIELFVDEHAAAARRAARRRRERRRGDRPPRRAQAQGLLRRTSARASWPSWRRTSSAPRRPRRPSSTASTASSRTRATRCAPRCWRVTRDGPRAARPRRRGDPDRGARPPRGRSRTASPSAATARWPRSGRTPRSA